MTGLVAFGDHITLEFYPIITLPVEYEPCYEKRGKQKTIRNQRATPNAYIPNENFVYLCRQY